jgi:uncharacterized membrane protein YcaP (DUF421 family)
MDIIDVLFGHGRDLNALQMGMRALVMFFVTVLLIRIAGRRTFGKKSAFDNTIAIMLGAILSRAVVGVSPFFPTIVAGLTLAAIHRCIAWVSLYRKNIARLFKGHRLLLYKDGQFIWKNMKQAFISEDDLMEGVRMEINSRSLEEVDEIFMEGSGQISVVKKKSRPALYAK